MTTCECSECKSAQKYEELDVNDIAFPRDTIFKANEELSRLGRELDYHKELLGCYRRLARDLRITTWQKVKRSAQRLWEAEI